MQCFCIVFHRYSNEYDINGKLKRLVNQAWCYMFISFTGWNHWQHCMNNKLTLLQNDTFDCFICYFYNLTLTETYVSKSDILGPNAYLSDIETLVSFEGAIFEDYNFKYRTKIFILFMSISPLWS